MRRNLYTALIGLCPFVASQSTSINPPANVPAGASKPIDSSFPSFGIQGSSFPAYTGNASQPNTFSRNLIQGIQNRTGAPLVVRVGGTNTDFSNYNPSQSQAITPRQTNDGIGAKFVFGPSFYEGFRNWPDTRFIYDVPFANQNMSLSVAQARAAINQIGLDRLEALELGNEVDLYVRQQVRSSSWDPAAYSAQFKSYSDALTSQLGISNQNLFEVLTLSAPHPGGVWTAENVLEAGITAGGRVKSISLHQYVMAATNLHRLLTAPNSYENTNTTTGLQTTLMSHGFMKSGVDKYSTDIQYVQQNYPDLDIIFGESGRYTSSGGSVDDSQGIFGAALWTTDYLLYLMTQNVTRVNMQLSQVFGYVAWHPIQFNDVRPSVRSPYFGHLFASEFMGQSPNFRVAEFTTNDDQLAIYTGYSNGKLKRIAIINYDVWRGSGTRPTRSFSLAAPSGTSFGLVKTLTSPGGATATGYFYWAGLAFSFANNGVGTLAPGQTQPYRAAVNNGRIAVDVGSSEAILIELN